MVDNILSWHGHNLQWNYFEDSHILSTSTIMQNCFEHLAAHTWEVEDTFQLMRWCYPNSPHSAHTVSTQPGHFMRFVLSWSVCERAEPAKQWPKPSCRPCQTLCVCVCVCVCSNAYVCLRVCEQSMCSACKVLVVCKQIWTKGRKQQNYTAAHSLSLLL